jgi:hypothetical protein
MQLATGTVVGGKVVVEGDPLPEGTIVTILARESDETFRFRLNSKRSSWNRPPKPSGERRSLRMN